MTSIIRLFRSLEQIYPAVIAELILSYAVDDIPVLEKRIQRLETKVQMYRKYSPVRGESLENALRDLSHAQSLPDVYEKLIALKEESNLTPLFLRRFPTLYNPQDKLHEEFVALLAHRLTVSDKRQLGVKLLPGKFWNIRKLSDAEVEDSIRSTLLVFPESFPRDVMAYLAQDMPALIRSLRQLV